MAVRFIVACCLYAWSCLLPAKTILITGCSQGIGKETALEFYRQGWTVYATSRQKADLDYNDRMRWLPLDLEDQESIARAVERIKSDSGRLDALINNAGYGFVGQIGHASLQDIRKQFEVNVFGLLELTNGLIPLLEKAEDGGRLINMSSTSGIRAVPGLGVYAASKFAVEAISEALRIELGAKRIMVSIIEPGTVANDWARNTSVSSNDPKSIALKNKLVQLSQKGQSPQEIAKLILDVVLSKEPKLRYQTNSAVQSNLTEKLFDMDGDLYLKKWGAFLDNL